jgi:hypothetical protein
MSAIVDFMKETLRGDRIYFTKRGRQRARLKRIRLAVEFCAIAAVDMLHDCLPLMARAVFTPKRMIARLVFGLLIALSGRCEVTLDSDWIIHIDFNRTGHPASGHTLRCLADARLNGLRMQTISHIDSANPSADIDRRKHLP